MLRTRAVRGFSLIELMITIGVLGIVLTIGLPNLATWLQNTQIRNQSEAIYAGLQLARAEALRRNVSVRFQLFTDLGPSCAAAAFGKSWVVSLADAAAQCNAAPSDTAAPQIIQKRDGGDGTPNAAVAATGGTLVTFNALGRVANAGAITVINVTNPAGGSCHAAGPMRCLRVTITNGGQMRMCDPAVTVVTDPRIC